MNAEPPSAPLLPEVPWGGNCLCGPRAFSAVTGALAHGSACSPGMSGTAGSTVEIPPAAEYSSTFAREQIYHFISSSGVCGAVHTSITKGVGSIRHLHRSEILLSVISTQTL